METGNSRLWRCSTAYLGKAESLMKTRKYEIVLRIAILNARHIRPNLECKKLVKRVKCLVWETMQQGAP
jgi:hypothetical protein